jgi:23S rRNA (uracil1939-C5)-methyltransferase
MTQEIMIEGLSQRGEGLANGDVAVPGALPGERVSALIDGQRGRLVQILEVSPRRVPPICRYFGDCGGCATQHFASGLYADWKRGLLVAALARARVEAPVGKLIDAHGEGRRRATFHARSSSDGPHVAVGFMRARAHDIVEIEACPVLAPGMAGALAAARLVATNLRGIGKPLDINVTAMLNGLDIDVRGCGALDFSARQKLIAAAGQLDLARLSNHGEILIERRTPEVMMGLARVCPPPGGFLQATIAGERILADLATAGVEGARRIADLFSGAGAFALRLAADHDVHAVEIDRPALAALRRATAEMPQLRPVTTEARDLFRRPLKSEELKEFDAVLFDPPRAGALAQSKELAASIVPTVIAVSCNATSFARDVSVLAAGGYAIESVTPIDQFLFSPHVEIVAILRKPRAGKRARGASRRLLG